MSQKSKPARVLELIPSKDHAHKPTELIQLRGHAGLTLNARRTITLLWHNAHRQGIEEHKSYSIEVSKLIPSKHKGYEQVIEAVEALMKTILVIHHIDGTSDRVQILGSNSLAAKGNPDGKFTYRFDVKLMDFLKDSTIWGRIPLEPLLTLGSKYSVPLYEHVSQWVGLRGKTHDTFSLEEFRALLGVEESKYERFGDLNTQVLKPVVQEINETAPFEIAITPVKTGRTTTHLRVDWKRKSVDKSGDKVVDE
jgi:hypothetical protein